MRIIIITLFLLVPVASHFSQDVQVVDFNHLQERLRNDSDTVYVVNFWATWCKPCTEEMPDLLKLGREYRESNFSILFVSLDMASQLEERLIPYIARSGIDSKVVLLDDPDFNSWIPKVDENWSGSIPATLVYSGDFREFHEGSITYERLKKMIDPLLNR